jgi:hypothetical protein
VYKNNFQIMADQTLLDKLPAIYCAFVESYNTNGILEPEQALKYYVQLFEQKKAENGGVAPDFLFTMQQLKSMRDADLAAQQTAEAVAKEHAERNSTAKKQGERRGETRIETAAEDEHIAQDEVLVRGFRKMFKLK